MLSEKQDSVPSNDVRDDTVDLMHLLLVIWKSKVVIIATTTIFVLCSIAYALSKPNIYTSEVLLATTEEDGVGGLASLAGQLGGLASLAGVNLSNGSSNKVQLALEVIRSREFASTFIQKHGILPLLMAVESWDMSTDKISYDEDLYDSESGKWLRDVSPPLRPMPSMQEAHKELNERLSVNYDNETGMITIAIEHFSPYVAQQWVSWLVEDINQVMKDRDVIEAIKSKSFLEQQIANTEIAAIREVLFKLIEEQVKTIMFARVRDEYVFKTVDKAIVPEKKTKPRRIFIVFLGALLGFVCSVMFVVFRSTSVGVKR